MQPSERKSNVLRTRRLSGQELTFLIGAEDDTLRELAESDARGRASKTLVKQGPLRITLLALKKGSTLQSHEVDGPVSIQIIRGCLTVTTDKGDVDLPTAGLVVLGPGVRHSVTAHDDCGILLTVVLEMNEQR